MKVSSDRKRCADDKENLSIDVSGLISPVCRPNERYVCVELPLENYVNKKLRLSSPAGEENGRSKAAKKKRRSACFIKPGTLARVRDAEKKRKQGEADHFPSLLAADRLHHFYRHVRAAAPLAQASQPAGFLPRLIPRPACLKRKRLLANNLSVIRSLCYQDPLHESTPADDAAPGGSLHDAHDMEDLEASFEAAALTPPSPASFDRLPPELLVRIICKLDHEALKPVFHVCKSVREAVMIARQCHFNFKTPGRDRKTVSDAGYETVSPFSSEFARRQQVPTPSAPKQMLKVPRFRNPVVETMEVVPIRLFPGSASTNHVPEINTDDTSRQQPPLPPSSWPGVSQRVLLFDEDELCEEIAQNML